MQKGNPAYHNLFNNNPLSAWVYDIASFEILDVNLAALKYYGYTKKEFLEKTIKDLIPAQDLPQFINFFQESDTDFLSFGTFSLITKNGSTIPNKIDGYKTSFQNRECIIAICEEVVNRIEKTKESVHMVDSSLDVFCTIDSQGKFTYVSAAAFSHWGYKPEELIGVSYVDLIVKDDIEKTLEIAAKIDAGISVTSFVNRYTKKNGGIAYNLWSVKLDPETKLLYCVARDGSELVEREQIISASEQRFKALVQEGADLIGILDLEGNYTYVSPTSASILGIPPEDFIGKNALEFVHPDDVSRTLNSLHKISTESRVTIEPFRFKNNIGEWRWVETVLTNMLDNPLVNGIVANSRDVTQRIEIKAETEATDLLNRRILESSPDCFKLLDEEGRIQFVNFNGLRQLEIDDFSAIKDKNWLTLWGNENEEMVKSSLEKALKGETTKFIAFCLTVKGNPKWWDVMVSPVGNLGKLSKQIICVSRDITEIKEEEQRLKLLESVITNTKDAILITEAEPFEESGPKIIYVNEAFTKMTGYTAAEVIGKTPRILQGPKSDREALKKLKNAIKNWQTHEITTINYKKNGEEFWINFRVTPVTNEKGWYTHWIAIESDVTAKKDKELENELLGQISNIFSGSGDFMAVCFDLCQAISLFGNFDFVEIWTANIEKSQMQLISHFLSEPEDEQFYDDSIDVKTFQLGEGLVGKAWQQEKEVHWTAVENQEEFVRREWAKKIGLKAVVSFPLFFNNEVIGVLNIGTKHNLRYLDSHIRIFHKLERFIGSELNRKKLEKELSHLFDAIPDILCLLDFEGRFLRINKAGCELMGYTEGEILYRNFDDFIHKDDKNISFHENSNIGLHVNTSQFENRFITKNGEIIWLSWNCNYSMDEGLIYATAKNVTERLHHQKTIEIQNEKLRNIAWTQSHVVRAPISRILGIVNLLEGQDNSLEEIMFWMQQLKISTEEMDEIVKKIVAESNHFENEQ